MSSKHEFVLNFTGFSNWNSSSREWMLRVSRMFPAAALIAFDYDRNAKELIDHPNLFSFSCAEEIMNWLPSKAGCLVNLVAAVEPEVSPIPTICILNIASKCQFWSVDMPNPIGLQGEALRELGLRNDIIVSNSKEFLELLEHSADRPSEMFVPHKLDLITLRDLQQWIQKASNDFYHCEVNTETPLVSVVTPSYNQGHFLEKTLNSVFSQNYKNIEYFVIDGGSTDNTIDVLSRYKGSVRWISEKDSGYPEAVNKGFQKCNGKYLMWLPSDDMLFCKSSVAALVKTAEETGADIIYGDAFYIDQDDKFLGSYRTATYSPAKLRDWSLICQPAALFRADVYQKVGGLNQNFKCISDYDLWLRMSDAGAKFQRVGKPISCYRIHGESLTVKQKNISYREIFDLQLSRYSRVNRSWVMGAFKEIVLQQNLGLRWGKGHSKSEISFSLNPGAARRLVKMFFESFFAENRYFQRFIRRRIEPREPIWNRGR